MTKQNENIQPAKGKLAILTPGMGAVTSTLITGVLASKKGLAKPIGSLTQMGKIRLGKRSEHRSALIRDLVPLASLEDIVFGGWDIFFDSAYEAALKAKVVERSLVEDLKDDLQKITPMSAVFDERFIKNIRGENLKKYQTKMEAAELIRADIRTFLNDNNCSRAVMVWCASTEAYNPISEVH